MIRLILVLLCLLTSSGSSVRRRRRRATAILERGIGGRAADRLHIWFQPWNPSDAVEQVAEEEEEEEVDPEEYPRIRPEDSPYFGHSIPLTLTSASFDTTKVMGGSAAQPHDAPFFAMLLHWNITSIQWEYMGCAGTLVSNRHVMTAGHCIGGPNPSLDAVYIHAYQPFLGNPGVPYHFSLVKSYTVHPSFDDFDNDSDVALVEFQVSADLQRFPVVPLADPSIPVSTGTMVKVYGFGRTQHDDPRRVQTLQAARLPFVDQVSCRDLYSSNYVLPDMVCAGFPQGGTDACRGDSGGPLTVQYESKQYQVGLVSWGIGCGEPNKPGVYTSVPYHYDWIKTEVCTTPGVHLDLDLCNDYRVSSSRAINSPEPTAFPTSLPTVASTRAPTLSPTVAATSSNIDSTSSPSHLTSTLPSDPPSVAPSHYGTSAPSVTRWAPAPTTILPTLSPCGPAGVTCRYGGDCCSGVCAADSTDPMAPFKCRPGAAASTEDADSKNKRGGKKDKNKGS